MLSSIFINGVTLSVITTNTVMLSVVAPFLLSVILPNLLLELVFSLAAPLSTSDENELQVFDVSLSRRRRHRRRRQAVGGRRRRKGR